MKGKNPWTNTAYNTTILFIPDRRLPPNHWDLLLVILSVLQQYQATEAIDPMKNTMIYEQF